MADSIEWLAGLLEGEGHFSLSRREEGKIAMRISANMTDEDVIRRVCAAAGVGKVLGPYAPQKAHHTPFWRWHVNSRADIIDLCRQLLPLMGVRRGARIAEMIAAHEEAPWRVWKHGTRWGYERGCRCASCKSAHAARMRDVRRRRRERVGAS